MRSKNLHDARIAAHAAVDWLWQDGHMTRDAFYAVLQMHLGLRADRCHMSRMDIDKCHRVIRWGKRMQKALEGRAGRLGRKKDSHMKELPEF